MRPKAVVVVRLTVLAGLGWIQSPSTTSTTTPPVFARAFVHPSAANRNANRNRATAATVAPLFGATGSGEAASAKASQVDADTDVAPSAASEEPARDVVAEMTDKALVEMGPHEMTLEDVAEALRKEGISTTAGGDADADADDEKNTLQAPERDSEDAKAKASAVLDYTWADALEMADSKKEEEEEPLHSMSQSQLELKSPTSDDTTTTTTTTIPTEVRLIVQDPDEDVDENEDEDDAAPVAAAAAAAVLGEDDKKEGHDIDQLVNQVLEKNGLSDPDTDIHSDAGIESKIQTDEPIAETDPAMSVASTTAADVDVEQEKADPVNGKLEVQLEVETENEKTDVSEVTWFELLGAAAEAAGAIGSVAVKAASKTLGDVASKLPGDAAGRATIRADVSVPYESASFLAYTEWLMEHNKEDPLLERYGYFQTNYRRVAIANVVAKKKMREMAAEAAKAAAKAAAGDESDTEEPPKPSQRESSAPPQLLALDQYADLSEEEYREVQKSLEPKSLGDLFGDLANRTGKAAMEMASAVAPSSEDPPPSTDSEPGNKPLFSVGSVSFSFPKKTETTKAIALDDANTAKGEKGDAKPGPAANHLVSMLSGSFPAIRSDVDKTVDAEKKQTQKQKQTEPTDSTPPKSHPFSFLAGGFRSASKKESVRSGTASTTQESPTKKKKQQQQQQVTAKSPTFLARAPPRSTETKTPPTKQRKQQQSPKTTLLRGMMMRRNAAPVATKPESSSPRTAKPKGTANPSANLFAPFVSRTLSASSSPNNKNMRKTPAAAATGIPALSQWKQNRDGSITGYVSNSQTYRTGTKITTSPVPGEARAGTVVQTDSGSKYRLK